jgi:hypothetical protein
MMFAERQHPNIVESPDDSVATRVLLVLQGKGITPTIFPSITELQIPGVVFRGVEDPAPYVEHGLAWVGAGATKQVDAFVQLAREPASNDHEGSEQ